MGLYLCVFAPGEADDELDGVEVGSYEDFGRLREAVAGHLGAGFPVLMEHSDSDGRWSPEEATSLELELLTIAEEFAKLPPHELTGWQADVARQLGVAPGSLRESFMDVDGEPLLDRMIELARLASRENQPILFQ